MFLTILDLILILILFLFIAFGFALGLIHTIGALVGVVVGSYLAGVLYEPVGSWLEPFFLGNANTARIAAFIGIFVLVYRLGGLVFLLVHKIFFLVPIFRIGSQKFCWPRKSPIG